MKVTVPVVGKQLTCLALHFAAELQEKQKQKNMSNNHTEALHLISKRWREI